MKILFLSRWFPYPPTNGSKLRIYNLLRTLAREHRITLISFDDQPETPPALEKLGGCCQRVVAIPWKEYNPESAAALRGFLSAAPRFVVDTFSPRMSAAIRDAVRTQRFDAVIASQIEMAGYADDFAGVPAIFDEVEIGVPLERYRRADGLPARLRHGLTWHKHRRYLARLLRRFPVCTVASERERELLIETGIRREGIEVIPNFLDPADYRGFEPSQRSKRLNFTGSFRYAPNYEAMTWFLAAVFPLIRARDPEIELVINGDTLGLPLPTMDNVTLTGFVEDVRPWVAGSLVSIAPLQSGGGTRLKILEALALRTPVVSTRKGAEGLAVQDGEHLLLADTPEDFAAAVLRLTADPDLRARLAENGYRLVAERYSSAAVRAQYQRLLEAVTGQAPS